MRHFSGNPVVVFECARQWVRSRFGYFPYPPSPNQPVALRAGPALAGERPSQRVLAAAAAAPSAFPTTWPRAERRGTVFPIQYNPSTP